MKRNAFTLIELLVVITIIALLVSILMPALSRAKHLANKVVCLGNLHGVGRGMMLYAEDNDTMIPRGNRVVWFQAFLPYVGAREGTRDYRQVGMYRCPEYPDKRQTVCYVNNSWTFRTLQDNVGRETMHPGKLELWDRPGETVYLADNESGPWRQIILSAYDPNLKRQDVWHPSHLPSSNQRDWTYGRRVARERHFSGPNCTFLDGHAAWVEGKEMTVDMWRDTWR